MKLTQSGVLHLKSSPAWYALEESGRKPNTVRMVDDEELAMMRQAHTVCVTSTAVHPKEFTRKIDGVWVISEQLGKYLVILCWTH